MSAEIDSLHVYCRLHAPPLVCKSQYRIGSPDECMLCCLIRQQSGQGGGP